MFGCLIGAKYNMTAVVLTESFIQDEISGTLKPTWDGNAVVSCYARAVLPKTNGTEQIGEIYSNMEYVRMLVGSPISLRDRVTDIKDSTGKVAWAEEEIEYETDEPTSTIFNVQACAPIIDPFGKVTEWEVILERVSPNGN